MVGIGMLMLIVSWYAAFRLFKGQQFQPLLLKTMVLMTFSGWVATLAGWYVTEIGRQPWLVQGVLSTESAIGSAPKGAVIASLTMYLALYMGLLVAYVYTLFHLARQSEQSNNQPTPPLRTGSGNFYGATT